jgi:sulfate/thiosulfate transport system substrate-binding protein
MPWARFAVIGFIVPLALITVQGCSDSNGAGTAAGKRVTLLNVSYDPTREFYHDFNESFAAHWKEKTGEFVQVDQSHGGSGKQARAVIDGLEADVITLALAYDIDAVADRSHLLSADWQRQFPHNSSPYTSTVVFLVRKGNPKQIKDWDDLIKGDVSVVTPNPKTSGGARWNYLAAWGYAVQKQLGGIHRVDRSSKDFEAAYARGREFTAAILKRVPVLDSGARGATNTFIQRGIGDVLLTWENEAFLAIHDAGAAEVEIVVPSVSILAEPPVALVSKVAAKRGTTDVATAYLEHLYSPQGQQLAAKHYFRPSLPELVSEELRKGFAHVELFKIDDLFGDWRTTQAEHFDDGGVFDQIYRPSR